MASVRITDDIRRHVRMQFDTMERKRVADQRRSIDLKLCEEAIRTELLHDKVAAVAESLQALNTNWSWISTRTDFRLSTPDGVLDVEINTPIYVPKDYNRSYQTPSIKIDKARYPELYAQMEKIFARCKSIQDEYHKLKATLCDGVLSRCTTLNKVLKLWPSALDFMPTDAVMRHREKPPKRGQRPVTDETPFEVDETVKATLAKERMINGSQ